MEQQGEFMQKLEEKIAALEVEIQGQQKNIKFITIVIILIAIHNLNVNAQLSRIDDILNGIIYVLNSLIN